MQRRSGSTLRANAAAGLLTLALHGLFVSLLVLEDRDLLHPLPPARKLVGMWIHLPAPPLPAAEPGEIVEPAPPVFASPPATPRPSTAITLAPSPAATPETLQPSGPDARSPVDWELEAQKRASTYGPDPETFSGPLETTREACKPHQSSMWPKKPEKKAAPPSWSDSFKPPPGSVVMGGVRVGIIGGGIPIGGAKPEPNKHLFDDMKAGRTPRSSVPDPNVCD